MSFAPAAGITASGIVRKGADVFEFAPAALLFAGHGRAVDQGHFGAGVDRQFGPLEQVEDVEHVLGALRRPHVTRDDGDARDRDLRRTAQQHHHSRAVVAEQAGIGVDDDDFALRRRYRGRQSGSPGASAT